MDGLTRWIPGRGTAGVGRRGQVPDGLRRRRCRALMARAAAAACAGLAVFAALTCVLSTVERVPVVVVTRDLARGARLAATDLRVERTPRAPAVEGAVHEPRDAVGMVLHTDAAAGQPLYPASIRAEPVAPAGHTVLGVSVASDVAGLAPGDQVALATAVGCPAGADAGGPGGEGDDMAVGDGTDAASPGGAATMPPGDGAPAPDAAATDGDPSDPSGLDGSGAGTASGGLCTLTDRALVMATPRPAEDGSVGGVVSLAMPPEAALRVMATEEAGAIVALTR